HTASVYLQNHHHQQHRSRQCCIPRADSQCTLHEVHHTLTTWPYAALILPHYDIAMLMANSLLSVIIRNALNQFYCHFSLSYTASPNWPGCSIPQLTPALKLVSPTPA
ncbi:hypothetical protein CTAM01_06174, partial [Colletotrichum tamarilloi]